MGGAVDNDWGGGNYYFLVLTFVEPFILKDATAADIGFCILHSETVNTNPHYTH